MYQEMPNSTFAENAKIWINVSPSMVSLFVDAAKQKFAMDLESVNLYAAPNVAQ